MEPKANHNPPLCCWNCQHFQRYDPSAPRPVRCDGECRLEPPAGSLFTLDLPRDYNKETSFWFPHITCGLRSRCARFEKTTEPDAPQSPMSFDCQHTPPTLTVTWRAWRRPDKRETTCFNCSWFEPELCQHKNETQPDNGCCLYNPPLGRRFFQFEQLLPRLETGTNPKIDGAGNYWCSRWEGPRPMIGFSADDPEPAKTAEEVYNRWEAQNERLVWLAALQMHEFMKNMPKQKPPAPRQGPPKKKKRRSKNRQT